MLEYRNKTSKVNAFIVPQKGNEGTDANRPPVKTRFGTQEFDNTSRHKHIIVVQDGVLLYLKV